MASEDAEHDLCVRGGNLARPTRQGQCLGRGYTAIDISREHVYAAVIVAKMSEARNRDDAERHTEDAPAIVIYQLMFGPIGFPEAHFTAPLTQVFLRSFCLGKQIVHGRSAACASQDENGEHVSPEYNA